MGKSIFIRTKAEGLLNLELLKRDLEWAREIDWGKVKWKEKTALVEKNGGSTRPYVGQKFDPKFFELKEEGWSHDHCDLCTQTIRSGDFAHESENQIICEECHESFIKPQDLNTAFDSFEKVER